MERESHNGTEGLVLAQLSTLVTEVKELREAVISLRIHEDNNAERVAAFWADQWKPAIAKLEFAETNIVDLRMQLAIAQAKAESGAKVGALAGGGFGALAGYLADLLSTFLG